MEPIGKETEVDRTERALSVSGAAFPLPRGAVELAINPEVAETIAGQKLLALLINELARMKGVVSTIYVTDLPDVPLAGQVPLQGSSLRDGLAQLVESLNSPESAIRADLAVRSAPDPAVCVSIGIRRAGALRVGIDAWRALLGSPAEAADWSTLSPIGPALGAALGSAEVFKRLLEANDCLDPRRELADQLVFSAFNYGIGADAAAGPEVGELEVADWVVVGCGAGGTAALYVMAMLEELRGEIALVEPGSHKLSNLNRYLMTAAADVHAGLHKLESLGRHLARFAPGLKPDPYQVEWEQLVAPPWPKIISTVDTIEARWNIQRRAPSGAAIVDAAVNGLYYGLLRVIESGWCLECKHPYDPEHPIKARAKRWGQPLELIREWEAENIVISPAMVEQMAKVQRRPAETWDELIGVPFRDAPRLTECGDTPLRTDVPSAAPILPIATTAAGVMLAGEVIKDSIAPEASVTNWWGHDLGAAPRAANLRNRAARKSCPGHSLLCMSNDEMIPEQPLTRRRCACPQRLSTLMLSMPR